MPKIGPTSVGSLLAAQRKPSKAETYVAKTHSDRAKQCIAIWNSIPKAERKFPTEKEQEIYLAGVLDERRVQMSYDNKLREAGLR